MEDLRSSLYSLSLAWFAPLLGREPLRLDEARIVDLANAEVDRLMPVLRQMRKASGTEGPVTEDEYFQASMTLSEQTSRTVLRQMQERAGGGDDHRSRFLQEFVTSSEADLADLATLRNEPTEENLQAVTARLVGRSEALTKKIKDQLM